MWQQETPYHDREKQSTPVIPNKNKVISNNAPISTLNDNAIQTLLTLKLMTSFEASILCFQNTAEGNAEVQRFIDNIMVQQLMAELPDIPD